jgi:hypothetical protein
VSDLLDYQRRRAKLRTENTDPAMQALLWGLVMGVVLAMLFAALSILDSHPRFAANTTLIRKVLVTTPLWITAIAYAGLIRATRTRTRVACAIICTVVACVTAGALIVGIAGVTFVLAGPFG